MRHQTNPTLQTAEAFVREVLAKDLNQKVSESTIRKVALKVSKAIWPLDAAKPKALARSAQPLRT